MEEQMRALSERRERLKRERSRENMKFNQRIRGKLSEISRMVVGEEEEQ